MGHSLPVVYDRNIFLLPAQLVGAVEYTDCISAEG